MYLVKGYHNRRNIQCFFQADEEYASSTLTHSSTRQRYRKYLSGISPFSFLSLTRLSRDRFSFLRRLNMIPLSIYVQHLYSSPSTHVHITMEQIPLPSHPTIQYANLSFVDHETCLLFQLPVFSPVIYQSTPIPSHPSLHFLSFFPKPNQTHQR